MRVGTRGGSVYVAESGRGAPVVLLHASLHDRHDFDLVVGPLAERFRVLAVDWPGHGESDDLPAGMPASAPLFADVLEDVLDGLDVSRAAFVGNSVGGFAAARLAAARPERVSRLVLVNAGGFTRHNVATRAFCRVLGTPGVARQVLPRMVPAYMKARTDNDRRVQAKAIAKARSRRGAEIGAGLFGSFAEPAHDLRPVADRIVAPTLLLWGERDIVLPLREGLAARQSIPNSRLVALPTGHVVFSSAPDEFIECAMDFLLTPSATVDR